MASASSSRTDANCSPARNRLLAAAKAAATNKSRPRTRERLFCGPVLATTLARSRFGARGTPSFRLRSSPDRSAGMKRLVSLLILAIAAIVTAQSAAQEKGGADLTGPYQV